MSTINFLLVLLLLSCINTLQIHKQKKQLLKINYSQDIYIDRYHCANDKYDSACYIQLCPQSIGQAKCYELTVWQLKDWLKNDNNSDELWLYCKDPNQPYYPQDNSQKIWIFSCNISHD